MSSDDNHWRAHMMSTARNICTYPVFATSSFNFGLPIYIVSHHCHRRVLYAVFYRGNFKKTVEQSCLTVVWQIVKDHTYVGVHRVDTIFFVLLVQFALLHLKILFCLPSPETSAAFLQEDYRIHHWVVFFLRSMFAFIPLFVDFVRYRTFWHHMIQIMKYRFSCIKSVDYFVCYVCRYGINQALFHQIKVFG